MVSENILYLYFYTDLTSLAHVILRHIHFFSLLRLSSCLLLLSLSLVFLLTLPFEMMSHSLVSLSICLNTYSTQNRFFQHWCRRHCFFQIDVLHLRSQFHCRFKSSVRPRVSIGLASSMWRYSNASSCELPQFKDVGMLSTFHWFVLLTLPS
jgi:hypothetical protein